MKRVSEQLTAWQYKWSNSHLRNGLLKPDESQTIQKSKYTAWTVHMDMLITHYVNIITSSKVWQKLLLTASAHNRN